MSRATASSRRRLRRDGEVVRSKAIRVQGTSDTATALLT
jgi:hypothetical protein